MKLGHTQRFLVRTIRKKHFEAPIGSDQEQTSLSEAILTELPRLRAYARMMTNDIASADRAIADTLKHVLSDIEQFRIRKALHLYLFMILRDILASAESAAGKFKGPFRIENELETPISLATALLCLTFESREAVVLQAGARLSRVEAATIIGCELHIYDARVRRGLTRLAELLPQDAMMLRRAFFGANKKQREMHLH